MTAPRSLGLYPLWLMRARLSSREQDVFLALYWGLQQSLDGSFSKSGWLTQEEIATMTGLSTRTVRRACEDLVARGLLKRERSKTHFDRRHIWVIPYYEPSDELKEDLHQKGWKHVVTEWDAYAEDVAKLTNIMLVLHPGKLLVPSTPSMAALKFWRTTFGVAKDPTVVWRTYFIYALTHEVGFEPVTYKAAVKFWFSLLRYVKNPKATKAKRPSLLDGVPKADGALAMDAHHLKELGSTKGVMLHDLLLVKPSPSTLPECVR